MALFRMVDGQRVQLSDEEEAEVRAEWARNPPGSPFDNLTPLLQVRAATQVYDLCNAVDAAGFTADQTAVLKQIVALKGST